VWLCDELFCGYFAQKLWQLVHVNVAAATVVSLLLCFTSLISDEIFRLAFETVFDAA